MNEQWPVLTGAATLRTMKDAPHAKRWWQRVLATGLYVAAAVVVTVVTPACRCDSPSSEQVAPSPPPPSDHWHPERKAACLEVSGIDGQRLGECAYALELRDLNLCGKCCRKRSGCYSSIEIFEAARECEGMCRKYNDCVPPNDTSRCDHCLACCKSYRCKYGFGEYTGSLLTLSDVQLSLEHHYPVCPIVPLNMPIPPCTPPDDGPACQGMNFARVGLRLADGTFVPLLAGKDEREVTCDGPWSTSQEGLPEWAPVFDDKRFPGPCYPSGCPAWVWQPQNIVVRAIGRGFLLVVPPAGFEGSVSQ